MQQFKDIFKEKNKIEKTTKEIDQIMLKCKDIIKWEK